MLLRILVISGTIVFIILQSERRLEFMYNNLLLSIIGILIFMVLPLIIAFGYTHIMKLRGIIVHEGNSGIVSLGWLSLITIPVGIIMIIILLFGSL